MKIFELTSASRVRRASFRLLSGRLLAVVPVYDLRQLVDSRLERLVLGPDLQNAVEERFGQVQRIEGGRSAADHLPFFLGDALLQALDALFYVVQLGVFGQRITAAAQLLFVGAFFRDHLRHFGLQRGDHRAGGAGGLVHDGLLVFVELGLQVIQPFLVGLIIGPGRHVLGFEFGQLFDHLLGLGRKFRDLVHFLVVLQRVFGGGQRVLNVLHLGFQKFPDLGGFALALLEILLLIDLHPGVGEKGRLEGAGRLHLQLDHVRIAFGDNRDGVLPELVGEIRGGNGVRDFLFRTAEPHFLEQGLHRARKNPVEGHIILALPPAQNPERIGDRRFLEGLDDVLRQGEAFQNLHLVVDPALLLHDVRHLEQLAPDARVILDHDHGRGFVYRVGRVGVIHRPGEDHQETDQDDPLPPDDHPQVFLQGKLLFLGFIHDKHLPQLAQEYV
jgi:hypothetical protein